MHVGFILTNIDASGCVHISRLNKASWATPMGKIICTPVWSGPNFDSEKEFCRGVNTKYWKEQKMQMNWCSRFIISCRLFLWIICYSEVGGRGKRHALDANIPSRKFLGQVETLLFTAQCCVTDPWDLAHRCCGWLSVVKEPQFNCRTPKLLTFDLVALKICMSEPRPKCISSPLLI